MENQDNAYSEKQENCFLIDWLTFTAHGCSLDDAKELLGLHTRDIPWIIEQKFRNGYPMQCYWEGITICYGADDESFYKDSSMARTDMGICINLSGTGCRHFESYGHGDWGRLLGELFTLRSSGQREKKGKVYSYNITRLDLAYDDHIGLLDIQRIESDVRLRNYVSRSKFSKITWSDDQDTDIQGTNVQVGSDQSLIKIRIYDKAAERGFKDRHWVRVELQLRDDRASKAAQNLVDYQHIGKTVSEILRNYLTFRIPSDDSNKSRWPIAAYWENILESMQKLSLWESPGHEYNFSKSEYWMYKQYGPTLSVIFSLHDPYFVCDEVKRMYPDSSLAPKYQAYLSSLEVSPSPFGILDSSPGIDDIFPPEQLSLEGIV